MRNTYVGSRSKQLPDRWQVICRLARVLLPLVPAVRTADRQWREEVRELRTFGFEASWDPAAVHEARSYVCEFCGNDMDLRDYVKAELGKHTYAFCTLDSCHWLARVLSSWQLQTMPRSRDRSREKITKVDLRRLSKFAAADREDPGRRVDLIGRSLRVRPSADPEVIENYLAKPRTTSARKLARKAVVVIDPPEHRGKVAWEPR